MSLEIQHQQEPLAPASAWRAFSLVKLSPFLLVLIGFIVFGALHFNAKLFLMGDDANYILDGYNFMHRGQYPKQSSLYGITMGVVELITGVDVIRLKLFSFLCAVVALVVFYRVFNKNVNPLYLYASMIFWAISSTLQYYTSSNLSEAFFMMMQSIYVAVFFSLSCKADEGKMRWQHWVLLGLMGLLISTSKNIAVVLPFAPVIYFAFYKQWKNAILALGVFLAFKIPYEFLLHLVYHDTTGGSQFEQVLVKDLYHPEYGRETFAGFLNRFVDNSGIYFRFVLNALGFPLEESSQLYAALVCYILLLLSLRYSYRTNKLLFFVGVYTLLLTVVTFFALQPAVAQGRVIVILVPFYLLLMLYTLGHLLSRINKKHPVVNKALLGILLFFVALATIKATSQKIEENMPEFKENIAGDIYYGYTPDWLNYLEMGKWINKNIPPDVVIVARKPNPLSVYSSGRPFLGISGFPTDQTSTQLLQGLYRQKVGYIVLASIRANAAVADPKRIINTLHNYAAKILQEYPESIKIIHTIGTVEPCYLVKVQYPPGFGLDKK